MWAATQTNDPYAAASSLNWNLQGCQHIFSAAVSGLAFVAETIDHLWYFCAAFLAPLCPPDVLSLSDSQCNARTGTLKCTYNCPSWLQVFVAMKDKMDLAIGVALGSSIQIAIFVIPFVCLVGWATGHHFYLNFEPFAVLVLTLAVIHAYFVSSDGQSHWLLGVLLVATYVLVRLHFHQFTGTSWGCWDAMRPIVAKHTLPPTCHSAVSD